MKAIDHIDSDPRNNDPATPQVVGTAAKAPKVYRWIREEHRQRGNTWYLSPAGRTYTGQIASVYVRTELWPKRRLICSARYSWQSTGNKPEGTMECGSVAKAKRWCEQQLAAFWEPPILCR